MPQPSYLPIDRLSQSAGAPRRPGARALQTRERLLAATIDLLDEVPYRDLTSAVVTQRLGLSAPAFYRYFSDINDALAASAPTMRGSVQQIAAVVTARTWRRQRATESALEVIDALAVFWQRHRALYRVTDLLADEGDARFAEIKQHTFEPLTEAFGTIMAGVPGRDPMIAAGVVVASLVHITARESGFAASGITASELRVHLADQVALMVTGARPR
ncbi:MAG: TetR family transcriptional regulator [Acidimicrobiales bacterium]